MFFVFYLFHFFQGTNDFSIVTFELLNMFNRYNQRCYIISSSRVVRGIAQAPLDIIEIKLQLHVSDSTSIVILVAMRFLRFVTPKNFTFWFHVLYNEGEQKGDFQCLQKLRNWNLVELSSSVAMITLIVRVATRMGTHIWIRRVCAADPYPCFAVGFFFLNLGTHI